MSSFGRKELLSCYLFVANVLDQWGSRLIKIQAYMRESPGAKLCQGTGSSQVVRSLTPFYKTVCTTHLGKENKYMSTQSFDQWDNKKLLGAIPLISLLQFFEKFGKTSRSVEIHQRWQATVYELGRVVSTRLLRARTQQAIANQEKRLRED